MKHKKILSCLTAGVLALCLGFGGVACMVTGLKLPEDWLGLLFGCVVGATVAVVCFSVRRGGVVLCGIGGVFGVLMALNDRFQEQLQAMLYSMFHYYHLGYGIGIPAWFDGTTADTQVLPLLVVAGLVMTVTVWVILRRKTVIPAVAAALVPLATCLVVTDTVPAAFAIYIYLFGLTMLIMTAAVRRWDGAQGNRLAAILALPVAAALALLMVLVPRDEFQGPAPGGSFDNLFNWFTAKLPSMDRTFEGELVVSFGSTANDKVDLSAVGRNFLSKTPVMEITSERGGKLYLRGRDYDIYDGKGWSATAEREEKLGPPSYDSATSPYQVSVKMLSKRGQFYLPCYPAEGQKLSGGMLPNSEYEMEYSFQCKALKENWTNYGWFGGVEEDMLRYLELPEQTYQRAQTLLGNIGSPSSNSGNPLLAVHLIERYVCESAAYDLNTDRMPGSETDFALWFLEQSDTGYCVHFATAATVLLRAAGFPARYVEGYAVTAEADEMTVVRETMAHAWVEYYVNGIGWVIMDPTPPADQTPDTSQTEPSDDTQPPDDTQPSTTEPSDPEPSTTAPTQPTVEDPSQPTTDGPTQPSGSGTVTPSRPGIDEKKVLLEWFGTMLLWFAGIAVTIAVVVGQWMLRRRWKLRQMREGSPNAQALARFREVRCHAKLQGIPVPDDLHALAEKARFSQHTLTKEELARFNTFLREGSEALEDRSWYYRLVCRFIYAAI